MDEAQVYIYAKMYLEIQIQDQSNMLAIWSTDNWSEAKDTLSDSLQRHEEDLKAINNWLENV